MSEDLKPIGKEEGPNGGWNGLFYETPETGAQRMYNAGYEKGRAPLPRKEWKAAELHEIIEYLLVRLEEENADDCDCGTDEPGSCVICRAKAVLSGGGDERWEKEAPVTPVRKWEADDVIGQTIVSGKAFDFYFGDATKAVQDALRGWIAERAIEKALLTSKPEPVAQGHDGNCVPVRTPDDGWKCDCGYAPVATVRKWAKEDIIGHCGQCDADVEVHHTFAEVQDALNGRKA